MAITHSERVGQSMQLFLDGMRPFVEHELKSAYGDRWEEVAQNCLRTNRDAGRPQNDPLRWDAYLVLMILSDQWHQVFKTKLGPLERSLVSELREFRNSWAHQRPFDFDDTFRVVDSVRRLLTAVSAVQVPEARRHQDDLLRAHIQQALQTDSQEAKTIRARRWRTAIYALCCIILTIQAVVYMGWHSVPVVVGVLVVFTLVLRQSRNPIENKFTVHECKFCGRIIYSEPCPYCQPAPVQAAT